MLSSVSIPDFIRSRAGILLSPKPNAPKAMVASANHHWCTHWTLIHELGSELVLLIIESGDLKIEDVLKIRKLDRWFYAMSHHPTIWKRFLVQLKIPLPTIRPAYQFNGELRSEAEQMVLRAVALDDNWRRPETVVHRWYRRPTGVEINEMIFLEGGKYLVASVQEHYRYSMAIFLADHPNTAAQVMLAQLPTHSRPSFIQAMYGRVHGTDGVVISFFTNSFLHDATIIRTRSRSDIDQEMADVQSEEDQVAIALEVREEKFCQRNLNAVDPNCEPSDFFSPHAKSEEPLLFTINTYFISLDHLEVLSSKFTNPGNDKKGVTTELMQAPPFRLLFQLSSERRFGWTNLFPRGETHSPHLIFYLQSHLNHGDDHVENVHIVDLGATDSSRQQAMFVPQLDYPEKMETAGVKWGIAAMCPLPDQNHILLIRSPVKMVGEVYVGHVIELYDIPEMGYQASLNPPEQAKPADYVFLYDRYGHCAWITRPRYEWATHPELECRRGAPEPLSIFMRSNAPDPYSLCHYTISPIPIEEVNQLGHKRTKWVYSADYIVLQTARINTDEDGEAYIGYHRSLVYCRPTGPDVRGVVNILGNLRRYFHPEFMGEGYVEAVGKENVSRTVVRPEANLNKGRLKAPKRLYATIRLPAELDTVLRRTGAQEIAYDESIGLMALIPADRPTEIIFVDFCPYEPPMSEVVNHLSSWPREGGGRMYLNVQ